MLHSAKVKSNCVKKMRIMSSSVALYKRLTRTTFVKIGYFDNLQSSWPHALSINDLQFRSIYHYIPTYYINDDHHIHRSLATITPTLTKSGSSRESNVGATRKYVARTLST